MRRGSLGDMLRQLPNALSAGRIVASMVLVFLALEGARGAFTWLLVAAIASDVADGLLARALDAESRLGAQLDSIGDALLLLAACFGVWVFHPDLVLEQGALLAVLGAAWVVEVAAALWRYRRLSSFHTYLSKAAGLLLAAFVGTLFVAGFQSWLFHAAIAVGLLATLEELALIARLPRWHPNVRGLWWVMREPR